MDKYQIEYHYQRYLEMIEVNENDMSETQKTEMRRVFFGAWGQCLVFMRDAMTQLDDATAVDKMQSQLNQVAEFWQNEVNRTKI